MEAFAFASRRSSDEASDFFENHPHSKSISPLPSALHDGLIAISVLSLLSFVLSTLLWAYLTYKLISWRMKWRSHARMVARNLPEPPALPSLDFRLGDTAPPGQSAKIIHERNVQAIREAENESPNQFLILIYNLFLADMHQAASFLISTVWLGRGGIFIHTPACFAQGFFDSTGNLSSCCFIFFIAMHTYLSVVKNYQPPQRVVYALIVCIWVVVYLFPALSILGTMNGREVGGFFTRAGAWCWISMGYQNIRLLTHYIFVFVSLVATTILYISIYISLRRQTHLKAIFPSLRLNHKQAFLIYPLAFVLCTLPLAVGRIATMSGAQVPVGYYCFAGVMVSANGFIDCVVFGSTRHAIIFGSTEEVAAKSTGLETFSFMRTPASRFGNQVWIQGGQPNKARFDDSPSVGGWWPSRRRASSSPPFSRHNGPRSASEETLRSENRQQQQQRQQQHSDMAIHMDVVTSMTVEVDPSRLRGVPFPDHSASETHSLDSLDCAYRHHDGRKSDFD